MRERILKIVNEQRHIKKILKVLKEENLWEIVNNAHPHVLNQSEQLYLYVYGKNKTCPHNNIKFISFSVGYSYCGTAKMCSCAKEAVSNNVKNTKRLYSESKKRKISEKRKNTNNVKYGVDNIFQIKEKVIKGMLDKHGVDNPNKSPLIKEKIKQTSLEKYGVDNPAKAEKVKEKAKNTCISLYNAECFSKSDLFKETMKSIWLNKSSEEKQQIFDKFKSTSLKKYGIDNPSKSKEVINKIKASRYFSHFSNITSHNLVEPKFNVIDYLGNKTDGHVNYYEWICNNCNLEFTDHIANGRSPRCPRCFPIGSKNEVMLSSFIEDLGFKVERNNRILIYPLELDIVIPEKNIAIEVCGVYWHSELRGKHRNYHLDKLNRCTAIGYKLITLWDTEIEKIDIIKNRITNILKKGIVLYARDCIVKEVDKQESKEFLNNHHIQGYHPSSVFYGLYFKDELISLLAMGKSKYNKDYEWEILRFCTKGCITVIGGASKLFSHFERKNKPKSIITYADKRWGDGSFYTHLGFSYIGDTKPGYWYFNINKNTGLKHRSQFTKKNLVALGESKEKSEWQIMQSLGYDRVWDCGNSIYGKINDC